MNLNEYQQLALRTALPRDEDKVTAGHDLLHAGMGLATEAGEFLDVLKKQHAYGKPIDAVNLCEEIGDILWYCAIACRGLGITLEEAASLNIAKLAKRYPDSFTEEAALNRDLEAERNVLEGAEVKLPEIADPIRITPSGKTDLRRIPLGTTGTVLEELPDNGWQVTMNGEVVAKTGSDRRTLSLTGKGEEGPWLFAAQQTINAL